MRGQFARTIATALAFALIAVGLIPSAAQATNDPPTFAFKWGTAGAGNGQFGGANSITLDAAGNVYVVEAGNNRVQKFDSSGTYLTKWGSAGAGNGQFNNPAGVATDAAGNVYVTDTNNFRVQKFDSSGTYLTQWGTGGPGNGQFITPIDVATDASGNVYVADTGNNRIQKFDSGGTYLTKWGTFGAGNGQFNGPNGVTVDASGNVYVTDSGNSRIQKFDSGGTYLAKWGTAGAGNGQFSGPYGITTDAAGNVYVADGNNHRIQKFDSGGTYLTKWGTAGAGNGQFNFPYGVTIDAAGNIYVADSGSGRIQVFSIGLPATTITSGPAGPISSTTATFAATSDVPAYLPPAFGTKWGTPGAGNGQFNLPYGVAADDSGNVYVTDPGNSRIQKFDSNGAYLTQWGTLGAGNGQFNGIVGIATDAGGNVYVADTNNNRIQKFDSSGTFITRWGTFGSGNGEFANPYGITIDPSGNVYVTDYANNRIQKFDSNGTFLTKWGTSGSGDGEFSGPYGIATDPSGNVYVAEYLNNRIQRFDSNGTFLTKWGTTGSGNAQFNGSLGVSTDPSGSVYVNDYGNNRIQKFDSNGTYLTQWGTPGVGDGQFNGPIGISIDPSGTVYIADTSNNRIQKFSPVGSFRCSLDAAAFSACTMLTTYSGLSQGSHTMEIAAMDPQGNVDDTPAVRNFSVDSLAPNTLIDSGPPSQSTSSTATFDYSSSEAGSTMQCRLDTGSFSGCLAGSKTYNLLSDGSHTFQVRATDTIGNTDATPDSYTWTIDASAPGVEITGGPLGTVSSADAIFTFTTDDVTAALSCKRDAGSWAACASPKAYVGLSPGPHTFSVRAIDPVGNVSDVATRSWTIDATPADTTPPDTAIDNSPADPSSSSSATFAYSSSEASSTFTCKLDGAAFGLCGAAGKTYNGLSDGSHTFQVRATDAASNTDATPASFTWTVDATAPDASIDSGPSGSVGSANADFTFSANEAPVTFRCALDGGAYAACTSPKSYAGLLGGAHTFMVKAKDAAGTSSEVASRTWTIDTIAPNTTIDTGPTGTVASPSATFSFSADEASTFECKLDGAAFASCTSPITYPGVTNGAHTFSAKATDTVGNPDVTPATRSWTAAYAASITTLSINAPVSVPKNTNASITGSLGSVNAACVGGQSVKLKKGTAVLQTQLTAPNGSYDFTQLITGSSAFKVTFAGNTSCKPITSIKKSIAAT